MKAFTAIFMALASLLASAVAAQLPVTEARVRAFARQAQRESRGDATALVLALDRSVRDTWGDFESFPISLVRRDDLRVTLATPYMAFRRSVVDVLRTRRRLEEAVWIGAAVVSISPAQLSAPDIRSVVLTRDGRAVAPIRNGLRPMKFSNGSGQEGTLYAGDIQFPTSAFAPGAVVVLTLRPERGDPFVYEFSAEELTTLR